MSRLDYIQESLRRDIEHYRLSSFETFEITVYVYPTSTAKAITDPRGNWIGFDEYNFDVWGKPDKQMKVSVDIKGNIRIWYRKHWSRVTGFLKHVQPPVDWNATNDRPEHELKQRRWEQQVRWWLANRKVFPLLKLPAEVREVIYGFAFGDQVEPYPTSKARRLGQNVGFMLARKANSNLLLTCKLVYQEASNVLFKYTPFFVEHYGVLSKLTSNTLQTSRIRQLELSLSHIDYLRLFGGRPIDDKRSTRAARSLRHLKLNRLQLNIAASSFATASDWLDGACQKTVVDWIFDVAWKWVRGHPVEVTGFVKTKQKVSFEAACLKAKQDFDMWQRQRLATGDREARLGDYDEWLESVGGEEDGGVLLYDEVEEDVFREGQVEITVSTPLCFCKVPCVLEHWTAES